MSMNTEVEKMTKETVAKMTVDTAFCACTETTGLFVPNKQLSYYMAGGLLILFFVFMAGFFWGQQVALNKFLHKLDQNSFADQISFSLYNFTDASLDIQDKEEDDEEVVSGDHEVNESMLEVGNVETNTHDTGNDTNDIGNDISCDNSPLYYAPLIGFGTKIAADRFVNRVTKKGFSVKVEKRISKTARGKTIAWYQVITDTYADKEQLEIMINSLVRQENLKDVCIVSC